MKKVKEQIDQSYAQRFERVFNYIDRHLDGSLSVDTLSQIANFSRFHFHAPSRKALGKRLHISVANPYGNRGANA